MAENGWKRSDFRPGPESNVRQWRRMPAGLVRPSGPCCFGVCSATVLGWTWVKMGGRKLEKLDFLSVLKGTLGSGGMCLQAWFVLQGPAVLAFVVLLFWARLG